MKRLKAIETIGRRLLPRQLSPIEQLVLTCSRQGQTYAQMAESSGYRCEYIREVGSRLWRELSKVLGRRVTKKNLYLVSEQSQIESNGGRQSQEQEELLVGTAGADYFTVTQVPKSRFPSGPLPSGSPLYIHRPPIEELAFREISQPACMVRIKASMKMGKSSLLNQIIAYVAHKRYKTIQINFQEADAAVFACPDQFLRWFCINISRQLNLTSKLDNYWDEDIGSKLSCKIYLESYLLKQTDGPLVLALNEVERVLKYPQIAQDFLPMLRSWYEQAQQVEIWRRLRLVLVHSTEIYVPLKLNQSPFNVGLAITLPLFTLGQVQELAQRFGLDWAAGEAGAQRLSPLFKMVGGHPYLVSLAFYHLSRSGITLEELLQSAPTQAGIYSQHLQSYLTLLYEEPQLVSDLKEVVASSETVQLNAIVAHKLESMGLIQLDGNQSKPSCELYRLYFREQLRAENWLGTDAEQLQQRQQTQHDLNNTNGLTDSADQSYFDQYLLSNLDELTHLANQSYFDRYLEASWQQLLVEEAPLSLILCKIDQIGVFDHTQEVSTKDLCLQLIGSTIFDCVNKQIACVAHYGDQSFSVILPQTNAKTAVAIADNIRASIQALSIDSNSPRGSKFLTQAPTVSLGVASTTPSSATSPLMLITAAEDALCQANGCGESYCFTIS